jgi:hypothetical protein
MRRPRKASISGQEAWSTCHGKGAFVRAFSRGDVDGDQLFFDSPSVRAYRR